MVGNLTFLPEFVTKHSQNNLNQVNKVQGERLKTSETPSVCFYSFKILLFRTIKFRVLPLFCKNYQ